MDKITRMTSIYNEHSPIQRNATFHTSEVLRKGIMEMAQKNPDRFRDLNTPFTIADLGCSGGLNSIDNLKTCINTVRLINENISFHIYLEDTPANDFEITKLNIENGLQDYDQVNFTYLSKSFYEPLFPEESMDIIFSNTSVHWIRETPGLHDDLLFLDDGLDQNETSVKWRNVGREDWNHFLNLREKELRKYGLMVICKMTVSRSEVLDQPFVASSKYFVDILKEFLQEHNLAEERKDFLIPCMWKEEGSITLPFNKDRQLKLMIEEKKRIDFPLYSSKFESNEEKESFVRKLTKFYEAFTGGIIRAGLEKNIKKVNEVEFLYNEFYDRLYNNYQGQIDVLKEIQSFKYLYLTIFKI